MSSAESFKERQSLLNLDNYEGNIRYSLTFQHDCSGWLGEAKVSFIWVTRASNWYWLTVEQESKGRGGKFLFLHFHSFSSFSPVPPFHLLYYLLPFSGRWHKMTHEGWRVIKPKHRFSVMVIGCVDYIIIIIRFLINKQVQGQHPHQWVPFQIAGLLHAWQISHQISRYVYHEGW